MKVERRQESRYDEVLRMEIHVLELINELGDKRFFATIEDKGRTPEITCVIQHPKMCFYLLNFRYVVMTLLGKPLDDLRCLQPKRRLSIVSVLKIGIQMMSVSPDIKNSSVNLAFAGVLEAASYGICS